MADSDSTSSCALADCISDISSMSDAISAPRDDDKYGSLPTASDKDVMEYASHGPWHNWVASMKVTLALFLWLGAFHFNSALVLVCIFFLPNRVAVAILILLVTLMLIPVKENSKFGMRVASFIAKNGPKHFPLEVAYMDRQQLDASQAYVVALEPHSVFPLSAIAFSPASEMFPMRNVRILASSALDFVPFTRHIWRWLGMASASRRQFLDILRHGVSCVIIPGGVQECLYMNEEQEVLFLKKRLGFIRIAMETGSPIVPAFCFGQRHTYKYIFINQPWLRVIARKLKFVPMLFWGQWGGPFPFSFPMLLVVGTPIKVPLESNPSEEKVLEVQGQVIAAFKNIYDQYKGAMNADNVKLVIS